MSRPSAGFVHNPTRGCCCVILSQRSLLARSRATQAYLGVVGRGMLPAWFRRKLVAPASEPDDPEPEAVDLPGRKRKHNHTSWLRILLVAPGPAFAIFCLINSFQSEQQRPGGYTGRFVQTRTAHAMARGVWFISTPLMVLCLFVSQLHQSVGSRMWTTRTVIEWGVWDVSVWVSTGAINGKDEVFRIGYIFGWIVANSFFVVAALFFAKAVRSIKIYQERHHSYAKFVAGLTALTLVNCLACFVVLLCLLGAGTRTMVRYRHAPPFCELSGRGISCLHDEFLEAFTASSANASCSSVSFCGYARWEDLCLAVQYSPLKEASINDAETIWCFALAVVVVYLSFAGSGRARHSAHLLSWHLTAAAIIVGVLLLNCLFSTARLLITLPQLRQPRSAAYFETVDTMRYELPFTCYGSCDEVRWWGMVALWFVGCLLMNFDYIGKICGYDRQEQLDRLLRTEAEQALQQEKKEAAPAEAAVEAERQDAVCNFWFVDAEFVKSSLLITLPRFQALQAIEGALHPVPINFYSALAQTMAQDEFCIVSHRWFDPLEPDQDGTQFRAIREYLRSRPTVKYVWFDFWCMPQGPGKTPSEKVYFKWMLDNINVLYLSVSVLIILDLSYISRFWTQYEAWLSMQTATKDGLRPATVAERRCEITPIYNTTQNMAEALTAIWATKSPAEAFATLAKPDVTVTNQSDKDGQLPKILTFDDRVREANRAN